MNIIEKLDEMLFDNPFIDHEIPEQDFWEMFVSSRNAKDFERKLKKYIKSKNKPKSTKDDK